jgi:hypothetical protein
MKEKTDFKSVVATLNNRQKPGDIADICRRGGFTPITFAKARREKDWDCLTKGELHAIEAAVLFFEERDTIRAKASQL